MFQAVEAVEMRALNGCIRYLIAHQVSINITYYNLLIKIMVLSLFLNCVLWKSH